MNEVAVSSPTINVMLAIDAGRTTALLDAIAYVQDRLRTMSWWDQSSNGLVQEQLVEPILYALGFDHRRRRLQYPTVNRQELFTGGRKVATVVSHGLGVDYHRMDQGETVYQVQARVVREVADSQGHIFCTNGSEWIILHHDEKFPAQIFSLDRPEGFWDLFILGARPP